MMFSPAPSSRERGSVTARHVGEDFRQLAVAQLVDLGAEEDFGGPAGGGQARFAVHQPRELLGQAALAFAGLGSAARAASSDSISSRDSSVRNRRHLPASASSTLIQY